MKPECSSMSFNRDRSWPVISQTTSPHLIIIDTIVLKITPPAFLCHTRTHTNCMQHTRHGLCPLLPRLAQYFRLYTHKHSKTDAPWRSFTESGHVIGSPQSTGLPASWHCVPLRRAAGLRKYPFVFGGIITQWPSHWCGTRTATLPSRLWPKQVDRRKGLVAVGAAWVLGGEGGCICPRTQRLPGSATVPYALRREGGMQANPD